MKILLAVFVVGTASAFVETNELETFKKNYFAFVETNELETFKKNYSAFVETDEWEAFKRNYSKSYANPKEESIRRQVYADNKAVVEQHMEEYAAGMHSFTLAINEFADLTLEEFSRRYKGLRSGGTEPDQTYGAGQTHQVSGRPRPAEKDWRDAGVVTGVKHQGKCRSCYAFSTAGAVESAWAIAGNPLVSLSEQQLVSCDKNNDGCRGGYQYWAYTYIKNNGIESEADYPYTARDSPCKDSGKRVASITSYVWIPTGDESHLEDAVANNGPVAVTFDASHPSFPQYSGGVYDEKNCTPSNLNHAGVAIGYGTENGKDFWLVKNSWGTSWGEAGYIKMRRNANNQCGIATSAAYPVI